MWMDRDAPRELPAVLPATGPSLRRSAPGVLGGSGHQRAESSRLLDLMIRSQMTSGRR
jgi:hypothetical protein